MLAYFYTINLTINRKIQIIFCSLSLIGQCLNFDCMFVLVLMLRQCITFLRTHGFSSVLPLDNHIYLHKMTGGLIGIFSVVHTLMHLLNFGMSAYVNIKTVNFPSSLLSNNNNNIFLDKSHNVFNESPSPRNPKSCLPSAKMNLLPNEPP